MAMPPPFSSSPPPPDGQFLLQLLQQRPPPATNSASDDDHAPLHLLDPAVAALGPCHSAPRTENQRPPFLDHRFSHPPPPPQHLIGWSVPASSMAFDVSPSPVPRPPPDRPRPPLDSFLPSPLDPLFRPRMHQSFGNSSEHMQSQLYPFSQLPRPRAQADHHPYGRPPPLHPLFPPPAGFSNSQRAQELARSSNSLQAPSLGINVEKWLGIEKAASASAVQKPQSFPQLCSSAVDRVERPSSNHPSQRPYLTFPVEQSHNERVSFSGKELSEFEKVVSSQGNSGKVHGTICSSKGDEKPVCWSSTEDLMDGWRAEYPPLQLTGRKSSFRTEIGYQGVYGVNTIRVNSSEEVGSLAPHVLDYAVQRNIERGMPSAPAITGAQGGGIPASFGAQRSGFQDAQGFTAATVDWEGGHAMMDDHTAVAGHSASRTEQVVHADSWDALEASIDNLVLEGEDGVNTHHRMRSVRESGRNKPDGLRKGADRIGLGHWVAVSRGKISDEETLNKLEAAKNLDFQLSRTEAKSNLGPNESAILGSSDDGIYAQKLQDDLHRRRGRSQEWRLKQPYAANYSQPQHVDLNEEANKSRKTNIQVGSPLSLQQDRLGLPSGTNLDSAPGSATEQSKQALHSLPFIGQGEKAESVQMDSVLRPSKVDETSDVARAEDTDILLGRIGSLEFDNDRESVGRKGQLESTVAAKGSDPCLAQDDLHRVVRPTKRILTRFHKRDMNRREMEKCTGQLISIFQTLIPPKDEELRRKELFSSLEELVSKNWPEARLYLFGSCANAFGVCNSDIDVCLAIEDEHSSKPELVLKLADVLQANNMENVQALPHARVPIVKYSDPSTRISCDVCVNNMLAVVNTKLLRDYAQIDVRLRQLAFIVKHWAKRRQVNETYRGTLSSYAYVLMCIHFLQQRKPAVLPCLQEMKPTYQVSVGNVDCAYYDQVEALGTFGSKNKETLGDLLISFFEYWAFRHDYSRSVVSIRTKRFISKIEKDWTRRIGNERHLICIEDPFETSHDLGRVVDKHSIGVLRDEFQRAAKIMRYHSNPCYALFDPFVRDKA